MNDGDKYRSGASPAPVNPGYAAATQPPFPLRSAESGLQLLLLYRQICFLKYVQIFNLIYQGQEDPIGDQRKLPYGLLKEITDNFSDHKIIGTGAWAKVYKGKLETGQEIAVKMFYGKGDLEKQEQQFQNELEILTKLSHPNIVQFVGYCYETEYVDMEYNGMTISAQKTETALCFEYLENGSLRTYLTDWEDDGLEWHIRYKIIKGICEGLEYLHEHLESCVYHLDINPDNILLNKNMEPKLIDFGCSRLIGENQTQTMTTVGTMGYMSPEYINGNVISIKFDIFSLGVTIIQIMIGIRGYGKIDAMPSQEFIDLVYDHWRHKLQKASGHDTLKLEEHCNQVKKCIVIALECVETDMNQRPTIGNIVGRLNETETKTQRASRQLIDLQYVVPAPEGIPRRSGSVPNVQSDSLSPMEDTDSVPKDLPRFSSVPIVHSACLSPVESGTVSTGTKDVHARRSTAVIKSTRRYKRG